MFWNKRQEIGENQDSNSAYLSQSVSCAGQLDFEGTVYIEGRFQGDVQSSCGSLVIGLHGVVEGTIRVGGLYSSGSIYGDVIVAEKAVLRKDSLLSGNIKASSLAIEDGAKIEGVVDAGAEQVSMSQNAVVKVALENITD